MRWRGGRASTNVDDRRGMSAGGGVALGGGLLGVIFLIIQLMGGGGDGSTVDPTQGIQFPGQSTEMTPAEQAADDERAEFVKVVLGYTEDVWNELFAQQGSDYQEPTLVLYRGQVQS